MDIFKLDGILLRARYWLRLALLLQIALASMAQAYQLISSPGPTRAGASALDGAQVSGNIYVFIDINAGLKSVKFFIDGTLVQTEGTAPWDFAGTETNNNSKPYDSHRLSDGSHQITASLTLSNNSTQSLAANITVQNQVLTLSANPASVSASVFSKTTSTRAVTIQTSDGAGQTITLTATQPWLSFSNASGNAPFTTNIILDASQLNEGSYSDAITATAAGYTNLSIPVSFTLSPSSTNYALMLSSNANRSNATGLSGQLVNGLVYVYLWPETQVKQVRFFIDSASTSYHVETVAPLDFAGTASNGTAVGFNTASLSNDQHTLGAEVTLLNNTIVYTSGMITVGQPASFIAAPQNFSFSLTQPQSQAQQTLNLSYSNSAAKPYTIIADQSWLSAEPTLGTTPASHTIKVDASQLQPGNYTGSLTILGDTTLVIPLSLSYSALSSNFSLQVSQQANRSASVALAGSQQKGNIYVHLQPQTGVTSVGFFVDRQAQGNPDKLETSAPFDLAGGTASAALPYNTASLSDGSHFIVARVTRSNNQIEIVQANFQVNNSLQAFVFNPSALSASLRNDAAPAQYAVTLGLEIPNAMTPDFSLASNVPWASVTPVNGTAPANITITLNPAVMQAGNYQGLITASSTQLGNKSMAVNLTVIDSQPQLLANPGSVAVTHAPNSGAHNSTLDIATNDNHNISFSAASDSPWLSLAASAGTTPQPLGFALDTLNLSAGLYQGHITLTASGYPNLVVPVNLTISNTDACAPVICAQIKVGVPYLLEFDRDAGHLAERANLGTGFTYVMPASQGPAYIPANIELNTAAGVLRITTTKGINYLANNNQANALGIGFAGPNQTPRITTQLNHPPKGTTRAEQAGLWFGVNEDNYVKLVYNSASPQPVLEFSHEKAGAIAKSFTKTAGDLSTSNLQLELVASPIQGTVTASYSINNGAMITLGTVTVDPDLFSFDAAGIDPLIGTRSFTGIFATHRNATAPLVYEFEYFRIEAIAQAQTATPVTFTRSSHPLNYPTNMAWAPDGKLYVTELLGNIHALTYDANLNVINDQLITSLVDAMGQRLTLGITVRQDDPNDPHNYSLWLSSSSPSLDAGLANSSNITRLSGPGFATVAQVITGLPRAIANHAMNSIHFGPDNRLYIAAGGNTGAGAPVSVATEFGNREEQPLSAALLVADVFAPNFDGSCANNQNIYGPAPCDLVPYATGLRNSYDFTFHTNGELYATDNGLGVTGAYPHAPAPDCSGLSSHLPVAQGGNNPGAQDDLLVRVLPGKYYGHPNPARGECVFKDGSLQHVAPLPNYEPAIASPGRNASADGIIEYTSNRACGKLRHNLLITRYSLGDDILRLQLAPDGKTVTGQDVLATGFNDPLTITEHQGNLFVVELGGNKVTALKPDPMNCWNDSQAMPLAILEAGSATASGMLYSIGGRTSSATIADSYQYSTTSNSWQRLADKPGTAVSGAAVAASGNFLYVMGGFASAQSSPVAEMWRYDIAADSWSALPDLPLALGAARAELINGKIYLAGGMNAAGGSLNQLAIFDLASNSWSAGSAMSNARDYAGSSLVNGKLYIFGGRQRLNDGTVLSEAQASVEIFDPQTNSWSSGAAMLRGRRGFALGQLNGHVQIVGGELNPATGSKLYYEVDDYNPASNTWVRLEDTATPRQGTAYGTVNGSLIIAGGGDMAGPSFKNTTQIFTIN